MLKKIITVAAALTLYAALAPSASAAVYTESYEIAESGSTKADSLTDANMIEIRNNRTASGERGSNLREAYIKIDIGGYTGRYPVESAKLRLYLSLAPSNSGISSDEETPTCDVYAFASFNTSWSGSSITYSGAVQDGIRPEVDELDENPITYAESKEKGYLDMMSFDSSSSKTEQYSFDITPFVNDLILRGETQGTIILMQAGGSISRESTVMTFKSESEADSAIRPAVIITPRLTATVASVKNFTPLSTPTVSVAAHNNTEDAQDVTVLGIITDNDGRVFDTAVTNVSVKAGGKNSAAIKPAFSKLLPEDIMGYKLKVYSFYDFDGLMLLCRSYTYGEETGAVKTGSPENSGMPVILSAEAAVTDPGRGIVRVKGAADGLITNCEVLACIYSTEQEDVRIYGSCMISDDGSFEAELAMPELTGTYKVAVGGLNIGEYFEGNEFVFFSPQYVSDVLEMINDAETAEELEAVLRGETEEGYKYKDVLGINYSPALSLIDGGDDLTVLCGYVLAFREENGGFSGTQAFLTAVKTAADLCTIAAADCTAAELRAVIEEYVCGTDIYNNLYNGTEPAVAESVKDEIIKKLAGRSYSDTEELCAAFEDCAAVTALTNALYTDAEQILRIGAQVFCFDIDSMTEYKALSASQKATVMKNFSKTDIESADKVYPLLKQWIAVAAPASKPSSGGGGGGGGGGSASGSSVITVTVKEETIKAQEPEKLDFENIAGFSDLDGCEWARESINNLYKAGVIAYSEDQRFRPNDEITRAEFVKMLVAAFDMYNENAECEFSDTDKTQWHYTYIASAYAGGIVSGISEEEFGAENSITREEMSAMTYRTAAAKGKAPELGECSFEDSDDISDWALTSVYALKCAGVINGISETEFAPLKTATRAEAGAIIAKMMAYMG